MRVRSFCWMAGNTVCSHSKWRPGTGSVVYMVSYIV